MFRVLNGGNYSLTPQQRESLTFRKNSFFLWTDNPSLNYQCDMGGSSKERVQDRVKRPLNAFMVWSRDQRRKMALENPNMQNSEISKRLGYQWKMLTEAEKWPFFQEAQKLQVMHREKYPNYKYQPRRKANNMLQKTSSWLPADSSSKLCSQRYVEERLYTVTNPEGGTEVMHSRMENQLSHLQTTDTARSLLLLERPALQLNLPDNPVTLASQTFAEVPFYPNLQPRGSHV